MLSRTMSQQRTQQSTHYVDGEWVAGAGSETFDSINPADGNAIATISRGVEQDVDNAVTAARSAFEEWRSYSHIDRAEYLWAIHDEMKRRTDELGEMVSRESGKEISEGRADVVEAIHMIEWAAGSARQPKGEIIPSEIAEKDAFMRRKPRGVVGCITPWNFPVAIPFWHMAVTLVEGNTVVWKPSEKTPVCASVVADMFDSVDLPTGVINMVQGFGDVGASLVDHDSISTILFTGSATVGHEIAEKAGGTPGKLAACEMGGKNALVITEHADMDLAIHSSIMSCFKTTGQRCVSAERLIVHFDLYEDFVERFTEIAATIPVGDPLDDSTFMGPLIDESQVETFFDYNQLAVDEGGTILVDRAQLPTNDIPAGKESGYWVGPFVYEIEYRPSLRCIREEVFGPHVAIIAYDGDIDTAIEMHNDTPYGLAGAIISDDYRQINRFRDRAAIGLAYANLPSIGAEVQLPFGGVKMSGNGFPSAREVIEAVTERTAWTVNNSRTVEMAQGLSADLKTD